MTEQERHDLFETHKKIVYAYLKKYNRFETDTQWLDHEDIAQEAMIALWNATGTYKSDKGAKFSTYASRRIGGAITDLLRRRSGVRMGKRTKPKLCPYSQAGSGMVCDDDDTLPEEILGAENDPRLEGIDLWDEFEYAMRFIVKGRRDEGELVRRMWILLAQGERQRTVANELGVSETWVWQLRQDTYNRLRQCSQFVEQVA